MTEKKIDYNLNEFKKLVRKAVFLNQEEEIFFNKLCEPQYNYKWEQIFEKNFDSNFEYASRVILSKFSEIEKIDTPYVDSYKKKIYNLNKATKVITNAITNKNPIIFLTDFDNDGSLSQAIIQEYMKIDKIAAQNMQVEFAISVNGNTTRGFSVDLVNSIVEKNGYNNNDKFVIVTADNGINSRDEQEKIQKLYPNAKIVITDHHNPDPDMVVQENDNTVIFNPHYKPTEWFKKYNISGANTCAVLLKNVLEQRFSEIQLLPFKQNIRNINKLSKVSNVLDYVETHPADKPEKDYVVSRFLELQPLLNINNSISKIITGEVKQEAIEAIRAKIPSLDIDNLLNETKKIKIQNTMAKVLLKIYDTHKNNFNITENKLEHIIVDELNNINNYSNNHDIDDNYIGKLRPIIFNLTADDDKSPFLDKLNKTMVNVFESVKSCEQKIGQQLRDGEVITKDKLKYSTIAYTEPHILSIFNRKFLNKVYNDENPGFSLTLDSIQKDKVSGSFRSLYDISDILRHKIKLERELNIKIETPGHERAAGFIISSRNPQKTVINQKTINRINEFINESITNIKAKQSIHTENYVLTDLSNITIIDKINQVIRGNVSHFERFTPIFQINKDTIWTDSYTTEQYSMQNIIDNKKYGYITININYHGDTVIVPVELVRKIVANNYSDYISLNYMDGGVFMSDRVIEHSDVKSIIDIRENDESKSKLISETFEKHFKDKTSIELSREELKDNPFFKYHDYGDLNFELFEKMVIGIIQSNDVDILSVFDVEANGFGNARLMNLGATDYSIDNETGTTINSKEFFNKLFYAQRGEEYLLTEEQINNLIEISQVEKENLSLEQKQQLLVKYESNSSEEYKYYLYPDDKKIRLRNKLRSPFLQVSNFTLNEDDTITYNRHIKATMHAYLVTDNDYKVSQEIANLTGITQELLNKYGTKTSIVDEQLSQYYKDKKILFGAHNTPYDSKIFRANLPKMYDTIKKNHIYDSALFSKDLLLAYDYIQSARFKDLSGIDKSIYFYHNDFSEFNLKTLLESKKDGYFPDRSGQYLLEVQNNEYFLVNKKEHNKVKIQSDVKNLLSKLNIENSFEIINDNYQLKKNHNLMPMSISKGLLKMLSNRGLENTSRAYELSEKIYLLEEMGNPSLYHIFDDTKKDKVVTPIYTYQNEIINSLTIEELPATATKYSVEKLSEQWMIRALLLSDEKFNIKYVDLNNKFSIFKDKQLELDFKFFQDSYHFDISREDNIQLFLTYIENKKQALISSKEEAKLFNEFVYEFLNLNKDIQQKFSDAWMYKKVLSIKDPKRIEITNDLIDLVHYQTNIPKDKIKTIFDESIKFKEKYKISHILQHEQHVNGLWEGDIKGDVLFEDKLTLSMLAQRMYDAYSHDEQPAVNSFNKYQLEARKIFDIADNLSHQLADDSYSFRQGLQYDRDVQTPLIDSIQSRAYDSVYDEASNVIKFKLNKNILKQDNYICAIKKDNTIIDREQLEKDKEMLSYIMINTQIKNSKESVQPIVETPHSHNSFLNILNINEQKILKYKQDLAKRYRYIEYNNEVDNIKSFIDILINCLNNNKTELIGSANDYQIVSISKGTPIKLPIKDLSKHGVQIIENVITNYIENNKRVFGQSLKNETDVISYLNNLKINLEPTALENAINNKNIAFNNFVDVSEKDFLNIVETKKQNPLVELVNNFKELGLLDEIIDSNKKMLLNQISVKKKPSL